MSASLVGSEMCIRDSRVEVAIEKTDGEMDDYSDIHPSECRVAYRRYPVSYTHLTLPTICSV
eukprot:2643349-Alexandrium_andersonii.AAC.1